METLTITAVTAVVTAVVNAAVSVAVLRTRLDAQDALIRDVREEATRAHVRIDDHLESHAEMSA